MKNNKKQKQAESEIKRDIRHIEALVYSGKGAGAELFAHFNIREVKRQRQHQCDVWSQAAQKKN